MQTRPNLILLFTIAVLSGCCVSYDDSSGGGQWYTRPAMSLYRIMLGDPSDTILEIYYPAPIDFKEKATMREVVIRETLDHNEFKVIVHTRMRVDTLFFSKNPDEISIDECGTTRTSSVFKFSTHTFDSVNISNPTRFSGEGYSDLTCY